MTDTQRSLADLQAILPDNTSKAISAQNIRDFLASALGGYGGLYVDPAASAATVDSTPAKYAGWSAAFPASGTTPTAGATATITVGVAAKYRVDVSLDFLGSAGQTFVFQLYKNGTKVDGAKATRTTASGTDVTSVAFSALVDCSASDALTVYASAGIDAQSVTVKSGTFVVKRAS